MGWTFTSDYRGGGVRAYLDRNFASENHAGKWEIVDSALVKMQRYYAAVRWTEKTKNRTVVFAMITLVKYVPRAKDGCTLGWKEMSETMGVYHYDCPLRILNKLCPPENDQAAQWREAVKIYHARRRARPKPGDIVALPSALEFTDGSSEQRFETVRIGHRKIRYRGLSTGGLYNIPRIERFDFQIEDKGG